MRVAGLISGTSLDAIDVCVVDLELEDRTLHASLVGWSEQPWPAALRERLRSWADPRADVRLADVAATSMEIGAVFAEAAREAARAAGTDLADVDLLSSHGQTVQHVVGADGRAVATLQLGEPAVIAERTGVSVAADFRPRDIAAGGQGAPLVAFVDALLFADPGRPVAALNLGGIANVTVIPAGDPYGAIAFDTGPANSLIDGCARRLLDQPFDRDGAVAAAGVPYEPLVEELLADDYFRLPPPKSTGRELFGDAYVERVVGRGRELSLDDADVLATVTELTAQSVARSITRWAPAQPAVLHVSGGGTKNRALMRGLERALTEHGGGSRDAPDVRLVDEAGVPSAAKEAFAFAVLGHETLHGRPNSLSGATGARHASVLGAIWPGSNYIALMRRAGSGPAIDCLDRITVGRSGV